MIRLNRSERGAPARMVSGGIGFAAPKLTGVDPRD
jgi:hypothetical protein